MKLYQRLFPVLSLAGFIIAFDRVTKLISLRSCITEQKISSFLSCQLTFNRGISWGMLHDANGFVFWLVTSFIGLLTAYLAYLGLQLVREGKNGLAYFAVAAGSCANLIDRLIYGAVIDFILFSWNGWAFPIFNVADIFIVCGVFFIAWQTWRV